MSQVKKNGEEGALTPAPGKDQGLLAFLIGLADLWWA